MNKFEQKYFQLINCVRHSYMPRAPQKVLVVSFILGGLHGTSATRGTLYAIGERGYASDITVKRTDGVALSGDLMRCIRNDNDHRFTVDPICRSLQVVQAHRITKLSARLKAIKCAVQSQ